MGQVACKVAPALLAACTMVLKPSEFAPSSAHISADTLRRVGGYLNHDRKQWTIFSMF